MSLFVQCTSSRRNSGNRASDAKLHLDATARGMFAPPERWRGDDRGRNSAATTATKLCGGGSGAAAAAAAATARCVAAAGIDTAAGRTTTWLTVRFASSMGGLGGPRRRTTSAGGDGPLERHRIACGQRSRRGLQWHPFRCIFFRRQRR